jgi:hypothetical protein
MDCEYNYEKTVEMFFILFAWIQWQKNYTFFQRFFKTAAAAVAANSNHVMLIFLKVSLWGKFFLLAEENKKVKYRRVKGQIWKINYLEYFSKLNHFCI